MARQNITALQKQILDCLAQGMTTKEITAACNCSESSVKQIRSNRKLNAVYAEACREVILELVPKVIKELDRIISDPNAADTVKIAATKQILEISRIGENNSTAQQDFNITVKYV